VSSPGARVVHASLDLLDRQLRDREGRLCGNVDDLEVERAPEGGLTITHFVAGGGALAYRLGARRLGRWLRRASIELPGGGRDRTMIPLVLARRFGPAIDLSVDAESLATNDLERWTRDHVVEHIPLGGRRARE
jgi:hypothetical protein